MKVAVLLCCLLLPTGNPAQVRHCKPDDRLPNGFSCREDSPFDPPEVMAERVRHECMRALVDEDAVIHRLAAAKSQPGFAAVSREIQALRSRHKELSHKIEKVCWQ